MGNPVNDNDAYEARDRPESAEKDFVEYVIGRITKIYLQPYFPLVEEELGPISGGAGRLAFSSLAEGGGG